MKGNTTVDDGEDRRVIGRGDERSVVTVDPCESELWSSLVAERGSSVFLSPPWLRVLADTYGFAIEARVLVDADDVPQAGFCYTDIHDMMDPRIVSVPFSDFCDPMVATPEEWAALVDPLVEMGRRIRLRCLRSEVPRNDERFATVGKARWHGIDLSAEPEELWMNLNGSARRAIRKARAAGVEVRPATSTAELRAFFDLHLRIRKAKYGLLAQPYRFFEAIWRHLIEPGAGTLALAWHENRVVGGVLYLQWQDTLYYKFNASATDLLTVRPNDLVIWHGVELAADRGLKCFDFGLSDWDQEGLVRYKRKYATEERTIWFLEHMPPGLPSERERQTRALLPQLTDLLVDDSVPDEITERAGDLLYQYFT